MSKLCLRRNSIQYSEEQENKGRATLKFKLKKSPKKPAPEVEILEPVQSEPIQAYREFVPY